MHIPWLGILLAFTVTSVLLRFGQPVARRIGWVDHPGPRKCHSSPTPLIGGLAIYSGYLVGGIFLDNTDTSGAVLLTVATSILVVGCLDDCLELRPWIRLLAEFGLALLLTGWGEVLVHDLGDLFGSGIIPLDMWFVPFSMIAFVAVINAVNMSDGMDGLAAGQSLIAFLALLFLATQAGRWQEAYWILLAIVVLIPFLLLNAPLSRDKTAQVFLGDAGSMLLGFALFWFTVTLSQGARATCSPAVALWLLAMPLIDLFSSIVRRLLTGHHPFVPDQGHIHHILLRLGYNKQQVFLILLSISGLFSLLAITAHFLAVPEAILFYSFLAVLVGYSWFVSQTMEKA
ncbi:MAG: undecaprenyl/decaprenyl-phosphate alpha-N-acetylglucosaminyl 1-phosphate transferase [Magnetococcales bacterium]|nr:undecaprenyl/decaprenyl-phosphate alpha-N-acetylglucosaminyl 1-phosphate transferase [Magnetococcales bacterium]